MERSKRVSRIIQKFDELTYKIENSYHNEEKSLSGEMSLHEELRQYQLSLTEYHMVAAIGDDKSVNGTFLTKKLNITKGSISKTASKLLTKGMIELGKLPGNKKEVYYSLTELGWKVYHLHHKMHQSVKNASMSKLSKYSDDELSVIDRFLRDFK
jgi:DNA-binding MarR family transcriptional regulator